MSAIRPLDDVLSIIADGCLLGVPREVSGVAMEATRALVRRGVRKLHVIALPTSSLQADLLIGAGCVETLETSAVSMGEWTLVGCTVAPGFEFSGFELADQDWAPGKN